MSVDPGNSGVTFTVKELLGKLDTKLDVVVGKLDEKVDRVSFDALAMRVTTIETENRLDKVAAQTLAAETERRRVEAERERIEHAAALEITPRKWSVRGIKFGIAGCCVSAVVGLTVVVSFYLAHH